MGQSASRAHERRISKCVVSWEQLQADLRHVNARCSAEFAVHARDIGMECEERKEEEERKAGDSSDKSGSDTSSSATAADSAVAASSSPAIPSSSSSSLPRSDWWVLRFLPATKLNRKSAVPYLWRVNNNVIIVATLTPKSQADAAATGSVPVSALPSDLPSYMLTVRQFYHLFLYFCDQLKELLMLRDAVLKIEQPQLWQAKQEERRRRASAEAKQLQLPLQAQQQQQQDGKPAGSATSVPPSPSLGHSTAPSSHLSSLSLLSSSSSTPLECCICLTSPEEEAAGEDLVVLRCLHSFCARCLQDWKAQSNTCPLCRRELDADDEKGGESDDWILTAPDLGELKAQYARVIRHPFEFVMARPSFPPPAPSNTPSLRRGAGVVADTFSLAVGEVVDLFAARKRKQVTIPVAQPVALVAAAVAAAAAAPPAAPSEEEKKEEQEKQQQPPESQPPESQPQPDVEADSAVSSPPVAAAEPASPAVAPSEG